MPPTPLASPVEWAVALRTGHIAKEDRAALRRRTLISGARSGHPSLAPPASDRPLTYKNEGASHAPFV